MRNLYDAHEEEERIRRICYEARGRTMQTVNKAFTGGFTGLAASIIASNPQYTGRILAGGAMFYIIGFVTLNFTARRVTSRSIKDFRRREGFEE